LVELLSSRSVIERLDKRAMSMNRRAKHSDLKEDCQMVKRNAWEIGTTLLFLGGLAKFIWFEFQFLRR